jgi:glycine/D-amino acid oxidase-like deaminating enzyme
MGSSHTDFDAVILGGGFYGCCIALLLAESLPRLALIEREPDLMQRASAANQARVHGGYHYPRSVVTAARSIVNLPRFIEDFAPAIVDDFTKLYGIARHGSKVNAAQFYNFFQKLGAVIEPAPERWQALFSPLFVEQVFAVREMAFDYSILRTMLRKKLDGAGVTLIFDAEAAHVKRKDEHFAVLTNSDLGYKAKMVFNCLYSRINVLRKNSGLSLLPLRHEVTEMALLEPGPLAKVGITIVDGAFFSLMPYPARDLHTLSHVRYTPHMSWTDEQDFRDGYALLTENKFASNVGYMQRDAARYVPLIGDLKYADNLFEVKTVLTRNDNDDGRPILFREEPNWPNFFTVMGGKIDNIYDILDIIVETQTTLGINGAAITRLFNPARQERIHG